MATYTAAPAQSTAPRPRTHVGLVALHAIYSASVTFSAGDVVQMVKVQKGAVYVDSYVGLRNAISVGTGDADIQVGDGDDVDRYLSSIATSAASVLRPTGTLRTVGHLGGYEYSANDTIDIVVPGLGSGTATGDQTASAIIALTVLVDYSRDGTTGG